MKKIHNSRLSIDKLQSFIDGGRKSSAKPISSPVSQTLNTALNEKNQTTSTQKPCVPTFPDLISALRSTICEGETVRTVGFDSVDELLRNGYRAVDGESDVIIARGGEREFAIGRELRRNNSYPSLLILYPTHTYTAVFVDAYRTVKNSFAKMQTDAPPTAVIFDENAIDRNLSNVFAELVSLDVAAFDYAFSKSMSGEPVPDELLSSVTQLVTNLTNELIPIAKDRTTSAKTLVKYGKNAAKIVERFPRLLHFSGADQTAEAVRMLYTAEDRQMSMRGETTMLLSAYVLDLYTKNLFNRTLSFPPDYGKRLDALCEYFHTDVRHACTTISSVYPPLKMRLCEYRNAEFKSDIAKRLHAVQTRYNAAFTVFKRLYPDDGYSLKTLIDRSDVGLCIALAPDVFPADTMLNFLKQCGRLEKYLL